MPPARAARCGRFFLGLRQAGAPGSDALDFCRFEKHPAPDADGFQLSSALQPMERGFANLKERKRFGACKQARACGLLCGSGLGSGQVLSPFPKRADGWRDGKKLANSIQRRAEISARFSPRIFRCAGGDPATPANGFRSESLTEVEGDLRERRNNRV
jgi:hypothetical protein